MASHTQDDGFHEIQLNGKQLVFLFMAATVVSVVFFLCGVWVGRGVRAERSTGSDAAALSAAAEPTPQPAPPATPPPAGSDPRVAAPPPPPAEDLSYYNRLEKSKPSSENLKPAAADKPAAVPDKPAPVSSRPATAEVSAKPVEKPAAVSATTAAAPGKPASTPDKTTVPVAAAPAQKAAATPPPSPPAAPDSAPAAFAAPSGPGYAVQIAALNVRTEADAVAKRLTSKGYSAYVLAPSAGTPKVFRVRVGKFPTRKEAESVATKLQKEEQFKPWITR